MMRIATYNVEWFDALFDEQGRLINDSSRSARHGVTKAEQTQAVADVFRAMDADAVMIVEAPDSNTRRSTVRALDHFAETFDLRTSAVALGFANDTQQEIALLYDPAKLSVYHDPLTSGAPRFDTHFEIDLDIDARQDDVVFSKPPLELAVKTAAGQELRMIGAHLKSKAPHGAQNKNDVMRMSIANRRKQLAQAIWLRRRVEAMLEDGQDVIVMGDLNDGPGLDEYEDLFGRSSVEIILGEGAHSLFDPNASSALSRRLVDQPSTARFYISSQKRYLKALLDYVMVSERLRNKDPSWRIWHPFDDAACWSDKALCDALLTASDHFPVTLDIDT